MENVVICGNPGSGKSTICNCILQQAKFRSGLSAVGGMTTMRQEQLHEGCVYIDTPGLADANARTSAAQQITGAFRKGGFYKIVFVIVIEEGRVKDEDVDTVRLVCNSIKAKVGYGLIVNKASPKFCKNMVNSLQQYSDAFPERPSEIIVMPRIPEAEDVANYIMDHSTRSTILSFLGKLQKQYIHSDQVRHVDPSRAAKEEHFNEELLHEHKQRLANYKEMLQSEENSKTRIAYTINDKKREMHAINRNIDRNKDEISTISSKIDRAYAKAAGAAGAAAGGGIGLAFFTFGISAIAGAGTAAAIMSEAEARNSVRRNKISSLERENCGHYSSIQSILTDLGYLRKEFDKSTEQVRSYTDSINNIEAMLSDFATCDS